VKEADRPPIASQLGRWHKLRGVTNQFRSAHYPRSCLYIG
jgi:hypothetical protein